MTRRRPTPLDSSALDRLVGASTPEDLDRALIDTVCELGLAPAAALWRRVHAGQGARAHWTELRSRGPRELLPPAVLVRAVLEGGLDQRLPCGGHVLAASAGARCVALVLGATPEDDDAEQASALLGLHATLVAAACGNQAPADPFGAPLPAERGDDPRAA